MKEDVWVVLAEGCVDRRDNTGDETSTTATSVLVAVYADHHQALRKMGYFQFTKDDGRDLHIYTCMGIEIPHRAPPSLQFIWRATFWTTDCSRFSFERVFCNKTCNEKKMCDMLWTIIWREVHLNDLRRDRLFTAAKFFDGCVPIGALVASKNDNHLHTWSNNIILWMIV